MYSVCYAPEGGLIATAHLDGTVRIWQADEMLLRTQFQVNGQFELRSHEFFAGRALAGHGRDGWQCRGVGSVDCQETCGMAAGIRAMSTRSASVATPELS